MGNLDDELTELIETFDTPISDPIAFHNHFFNKEVGRHHKVLISGNGADEVLGGYPRYTEIIDKLGQGSTTLTKFLELCSTLDVHWRRFQEFELIYGRMSEGGDKGADILRQELPDEEDGLPERFARLLDFFLFHRAVNFTIPDECSYINNVEVRSPFYDYDLVRWAFALNNRELHGPTGGKMPLRRLLKGTSLDYVANSAKIGFNDSYNYGDWLQRPSRIVLELTSIASLWIRRHFGIAAAERVSRLTADCVIAQWRMCALGGWLRKGGLMYG